MLKLLFFLLWDWVERFLGYIGRLNYLRDFILLARESGFDFWI